MPQLPMTSPFGLAPNGPNTIDPQNGILRLVGSPLLTPLDYVQVLLTTDPNTPDTYKPFNRTAKIHVQQQKFNDIVGWMLDPTKKVTVSIVYENGQGTTLLIQQPDIESTPV